MRLGVRAKLFSISLALLAVVGMVSGLLLESQIRALLLRKSEADLLRHVSTIREAIEMGGRAADPRRLTDTVRRLATVTGTRISVIDASGALLADSHVATPDLAAQAPQSAFPEVEEAQLRGRGLSQRHSVVLGADALFAAVPVRLGHQTSVVRAALPLVAIEDTLSQVRTLLWGAGLVGLILASVMTALASHYLSRAFRAVVDKAQALLSRRLSRQVDSRSSDELGVLAFSLDRLADETERLLGELAAERDRMAAILDGMKDGVVALDRRGRVTLINRAAREMLNPRESEPGTVLEECIREARLVEVVSEALNGQSQTEEIEIAGPPPRTLVVHTALPRGGSGGAIVALWDVTTLRRLERVRRDFVANVSHELRTPVSVVRANAELFLDSALADAGPAHDLADAILRNAERMGRLVEDLLTLARIEAGKYQISMEPLLVQTAADDALRIVSDTARGRSVVIAASIPPNLVVVADRKALDHVLVNLVDNAVKYGHSGGRVELRAFPVGDNVRIEVVDEGPGIAPQHRSRVFERFYRVDTGRTRDTGGTGLGLSIARHLVESMGGTVGVEAGQPRGSIFWLSLPRGAITADELSPAELSRAGSVTSPDEALP